MLTNFHKIAEKVKNNFEKKEKKKKKKKNDFRWRCNSIHSINQQSGINRHFQLNPILIWEFEMVVRIIFLRDIVKDYM